MAIGAIAMLAMAGPAAAQANQGPPGGVFQVTAVIQVPITGQGAQQFFSFDISWNDPVLNKFFLADRNNKAIDVVDPTTFQITQFVNPGYAGFTGNNDTSGPDGVLTANNSTELWVGDSPGKVWVLNSTTGAVKRLPGGAPNPIMVGGTTRADELCYDPVDNLIMIASPAEDPPFVSFINTTTYRVVRKLPFDGMTRGTPRATNGLEQCGWSPDTGLFYQNVPEVNGPGNDTAPGAVSVINPVTQRVTRNITVPLAACAGPQGMAIGPNNQILLGCNAAGPDGRRNTAVIDANSGRVATVLATFQDLGGLDAVTFNPGNGLYFLPSCNTACRTVGNGIFGSEILGVVDSNTLQVVQSLTIASQNGATTVTAGNPRTTHSVAADPNSLNVFLPIPSVGGTAPQFAPTLCDSRNSEITVIGGPSTATGCIAILGPTTTDLTGVPPGQGMNP